MKCDNDLVYAIGLISSDGSLSKDSRHIDFTSKDFEQIVNFKKALNINNKIGTKKDGRNNDRVYYRIQFSNVKLYRFLESIGLHPNKSKTIKTLAIPNKYFFDFLRGCLDGDGNVYHYWDKRWRSSFMFYTRFYSASEIYLLWLKEKVYNLNQAKGSICYKDKSTYELSFAKTASIILASKMYSEGGAVFLNRKKFIIDDALGIIKAV